MPQLSKFSYPLIVLSEVPLKVPIPGMTAVTVAPRIMQGNGRKSVVQRFNLIKIDPAPERVGSFWS
jgi:hypothetical protein